MAKRPKPRSAMCVDSIRLPVATLGWMYTLFFVFLGCSAALWGAWLERAGPRKAAFVSALQRLVPEVQAEHLVPAPAGVRAQALTRDGNLVDDFLIVENDLVINVCNAPSPAATASLNIGRLIVDKLSDRLGSKAA